MDLIPIFTHEQAWRVFELRRRIVEGQAVEMRWPVAIEIDNPKDPELVVAAVLGAG
jgi:hypothetical protein